MKSSIYSTVHFDFRPVFCFVDFPDVETLSFISSSLDSCESESSFEDALNEKEVIYFIDQKKKKKKHSKPLKAYVQKETFRRFAASFPPFQ